MTYVVEMHEWERRGPEQDPALADLVLTPEGRSQLADLARFNVLEVQELRSGVVFRSSSFVGRIPLGNVTVTIRPKMASDMFLRLLRYAYRLPDVQLLEEAVFATDDELLPDLLAHELLREVSVLVRRGLTRRYVERTEALASPRGRQHMRQVANGGFLLDGRLPSTFHERSSDFVLNRVLRAGLDLAASIAGDAGLRASLRSLAAGFEVAVERVPLTRRLLTDAQRALSRLTAGYTGALRLIELIYEAMHPSFEGAELVSLRGFHFDMNRFFQRLVERFLRESLPDCHVETEVALRELVRFQKGANPCGRRAPRPRPDFLVSKGDRSLVLDAKYRDLWAWALPRDMFYQLSLYALAQPRPGTATILYPTPHEEAVDAVLELREPSTGAACGRVVLRPVILPRLLVAVESARERTCLAGAWTRELVTVEAM